MIHIHGHREDCDRACAMRNHHAIKHRPPWQRQRNPGTDGIRPKLAGKREWPFSLNQKILKHGADRIDLRKHRRVKRVSDPCLKRLKLPVILPERVLIVGLRALKRHELADIDPPDEEITPLHLLKKCPVLFIGRFGFTGKATHEVQAGKQMGNPLLTNTANLVYDGDGPQHLFSRCLQIVCCNHCRVSAFQSERRHITRRMIPHDDSERFP